MIRLEVLAPGARGWLSSKKSSRSTVGLGGHTGLGDFTPGVARAKAAGLKIEVAPYPEGVAGVKLSLSVIAQKIRDGRLDPDIRGWAGDVLIAAGKPKTIREKAQAILDAFRKATMYLPDPVGAEYIASGAATLCLRPGLCVRARDCDDGVTLIGSALMSVGIPVVVLKQNFGPGKQEHVLIEARDEQGIWFPVDPSTSLDAGSKVPAVSEERINPMDVMGSNGTSGAEIVTIGFVDEETRDVHFDDARKTYVEKRYGKLWVYQGVGVGWAELEGAGDACCAACAAGAPKCPCEKDGTGTPDPDPEPPCTSCEAYARRLQEAGMAGLPAAVVARTVVARAFNPLGLKVGLGQTTTPTLEGPGIGLGTVVVTLTGMAVAAGVGWGIARRRAA